MNFMFKKERLTGRDLFVQLRNSVLIKTIGNPGSLCASRDTTLVNTENMFRSENLLENGNKNR